ncbi:MAG: acyl-ACP desaturase, partial [Patescibacteria group bacterium]
YQEIVTKVIQLLNIGSLTNLNDVGQKAQSAIMAIPNRLEKISERIHISLKSKTFNTDILFGNPQIILPGA